MRYATYKLKRTHYSQESGEELSSHEGEIKEEEQREANDYVDIKIKGLQDAIQYLKSIQIVEQNNINEIQSKINQLKMDHNLKNTAKIKKDLSRQEKYMTSNRV